MSILYDTNITTGDLAATTIVSGGAGSELATIVSVHMVCATPVALSWVTATLRWHDGISNRVLPLTILLTSLNNYLGRTETILTGPYKDLTLEIDSYLLGEYRVVVHGHNITFTA